MKIRREIVRIVRENKLICLIEAVTAVYLCINMFMNGPWYDELYTYYSFISRGPVYAAIHWPVPNNHIGYSVISGMLIWIPNAYIRLRAISVIAALSNIALIYYIVKSTMSKPMGVTAAVLYMGANLVNSLSFQGRGYALATTCMLISIVSVIKIYEVGNRLRYYVSFAVCLALGLYIIPSSLYWVMPLCLFGGLLLLFSKRYRELRNLILSSLSAAAATIILYGLVWLAIGANLLSKNAESAYYGLHQIKVLLKAPFQSVKTGIDYMLATPYIQSIDRRIATLGMPEYFVDLFDYCYERLGLVLLILAVMSLIMSIIITVKKRGTDAVALLTLVLLSTVPLMLLIQSVHPYKRVLSFMMIPLALGIAIMLHNIPGIKRGETYISAAAVVLVAITFTTYPYRAPVADRENNIHEVLKLVDVKDIDSIYYVDDYQKYVLKFYYNSAPEEKYVGDASFVIMPSELMDEATTQWDWPLLTGYDEELVMALTEGYEEIASTDKYIVFRKK